MRLHAAVLFLLSAAVPLSPRAVALIDARPDHVARFAATHPLVEPIQWTVAREIVAASYRAGIPPAMGLHVGWRESRFLPDFVSTTDDWGPLQVNAHWTPEIVRQTTAERIATGVRILAEDYRACGSWAGADRRYRTGHCQ
jgi:soluble lytic murein transglycosylase-like protein